MAMVKCAECGNMVSDKAANCPSCGAPIAGVQATKQEKEHSVRSGAITGLIGAVAYPIVLGIAKAIQDNTPDNPDAYTISVNPAEGWTIVFPAIVCGVCIGAICFVIGVAFGNRLDRTKSLILACISLIASLAVLVSVFAGINVLLVCVGWVFGWEPVLMTWGSVKMLKSSLRMPK